MDTSDSGHSMSSSISIPQWMKPRIQDGIDMEISTISPPNQDDSFLYIPYSKFSKPATSSAGASSICTNSAIAQSSQATSSNSLISKHTTPCLKFLGEGKTMDSNDLTSFYRDDKKFTKPVKSFGTDDGFKSEAAQCGHSVVQVAQQMIADRLVGRPSKLGTSKTGDSEVPYMKQRVRRGSKSLPASPLSTPDSTPQIQRKNRYFTGTYVEETPKFPGSWLMAGLLGVHRENLSESLTDLASDSNNNASLQSQKVHAPDSLLRNDSSSMLLQSAEKPKPDTSTEDLERGISSLHVSRSAASLVKNPATENSVKKPRPKPSELREMNFLSPTSM